MEAAEEVVLERSEGQRKSAKDRRTITDPELISKLFTLASSVQIPKAVRNVRANVYLSLLVT
jgi:hypothetical protein